MSSVQNKTQNRNSEKQYDKPFLDMSLVDASEVRGTHETRVIGKINPCMVYLVPQCLKLIQMEDASLVALAGLSLSGYSFEQHPEMVSYVKQVSICGK